MLYGIYQADSEVEAAEKVKEFIHKWSEQELPEFKDVLKVLVKWLPEILASHHENHITNGPSARTTSSVCSNESSTASSTPIIRGKSDAVVSSHAIIAGLSVRAHFPRNRGGPRSRSDPRAQPTEGCVWIQERREN